MEIIQQDTSLLCENKLIDYSLLVFKVDRIKSIKINQNRMQTRDSVVYNIATRTYETKKLAD